MSEPPALLIIFPTTNEASISIGCKPGSSPQRVTFAGVDIWAGIAGFGIAGAAAQTGYLLARLPMVRRVVLAGIAGTFKESKFPVATAAWASSVTQFGIGVREQGKDTPLPFPHLPDESAAESVQLSIPPFTDCSAPFLSVCAASGDASEAQSRRNRYPASIGEEMEGFGVALTCHLWRKEFTMVRGFSNPAGDRDSRHWKIPEALAAVRRELVSMLQDHHRITP